MSIKLTEVQADLDELNASLSEGRAIDPELKKRIRDRSDKLREEVKKSHGSLNVAVDLIRANREE